MTAQTPPVACPECGGTTFTYVYQAFARLKFAHGVLIDANAGNQGDASDFFVSFSCDNEECGATLSSDGDGLSGADLLNKDLCEDPSALRDFLAVTADNLSDQVADAVMVLDPVWTAQIRIGRQAAKAELDRTLAELLVELRAT